MGGICQQQTGVTTMMTNKHGARQLTRHPRQGSHKVWQVKTRKPTAYHQLGAWQLGHTVTWQLGHTVTRQLGHTVTWQLGHTVNYYTGGFQQFIVFQFWYSLETVLKLPEQRATPRNKQAQNKTTARLALLLQKLTSTCHVHFTADIEMKREQIWSSQISFCFQLQRSFSKFTFVQRVPTQSNSVLHQEPGNNSSSSQIILKHFNPGIAPLKCLACDVSEQISITTDQNSSN